MKKFILIVLFANFLSLINGQDDSELCPTYKEIFPCTCDREGINCISIKNENELHKSFDHNSKIKISRSFWLNGTPLKKLSRNIFNGYRFVNFFLEDNNISEIENGAFIGSENVTNLMSFDRNSIENFPFSYIQTFRELKGLSLSYNKLNEIPDYAFKNLNKLTQVNLMNNKISKIGLKPFYSCSTLQLIALDNNELTELGPYAFANDPSSEVPVQISLAKNKISYIHPSAFQSYTIFVINLQDNRLTYLDEKVFKPLRSVQAVSVFGNPFKCGPCDKHKWLVDNYYAFSIFLGFVCENNQKISDLTKKSIGCRNIWDG